VFRINLYRANATNKGEGLAFVIASSNAAGPTTSATLASPTRPPTATPPTGLRRWSWTR
jgi:hypothetical protein